MGTLATRPRNGKKPARPVERALPRVDKLAIALRELQETREQQEATAEILRITARAPHDAKLAFEAITRAAARLVHGSRVALFLVKEGKLDYVAHAGLGHRRHGALSDAAGSGHGCLGRHLPPARAVR